MAGSVTIEQRIEIAVDQALAKRMPQLAEVITRRVRSEMQRPARRRL